MRPRVCAAIIRDKKKLMVRHEHDGQSYWTLPGGGVESGETFEQAVIREIFEEHHLHISVGKFLFEEPHKHGTTYCYLAAANDCAEARLGNYPEEREMPLQCRMLKEVGWHSLAGCRRSQIFYCRTQINTDKYGF